MPCDPQRHPRRSIRLPGYDDPQPGASFTLIVPHNRMPRVCPKIGGQLLAVVLQSGEIARAEWLQTPIVRPHGVLHPDEWVMMPNPAHGILRIADAPASGPGASNP
jgi:putative transposase